MYDVAWGVCGGRKNAFYADMPVYRQRQLLPKPIPQLPAVLGWQDNRS
jgi:hypothetical protein